MDSLFRLSQSNNSVRSFSRRLASYNVLAGLALYSYKKNDTVWELASGNTSNILIDCSQTLRRGEYFIEFVEALSLELNMAGLDYKFSESSNFEYVAGPASGADPICAALICSNIDWLSIRKAPKGRGLDTGRISGPIPDTGGRVLVVDDVLTTGGSIIDTIRVCRDYKLEIVGGLVVVDRQEFDGYEAVKRELGDKKLLCLYTKNDIEDMIDGKIEKPHFDYDTDSN